MICNDSTPYFTLVNLSCFNSVSVHQYQYQYTRYYGTHIQIYIKKTFRLLKKLHKLSIRQQCFSAYWSCW